MSQDEPAALELCPVVHQRLVVEVVTTFLLPVVALADKEVRLARDPDQGVCPYGISREREDLTLVRHPQGVGGGTAGVHDMVRGYHERTNLGGGLVLELDEL